MRVAVERRDIRMNRIRRPVTIAPELVELAPARPTRALLESLRLNPILLEVYAAAHPLVLLEADGGELILVAGHETWGLAQALVDDGGRSVTLPAWHGVDEGVPARAIASVVRFLETALRPRGSRRELVEVVGPVAGPLLGIDGPTGFAAYLGISRQALGPRCAPWRASSTSQQPGAPM